MFQKLLLAFGNQMQAKWQGIEMLAIYQDWADELASYSLGSINHAIRLCRSQEHPPSLSKFMENCKKYIPEINQSILISDNGNITIGKEEALEMLKKIREDLAANMTKC